MDSYEGGWVVIHHPIPVYVRLQDPAPTNARSII
jgi:hypothetical protein